MFIHLGLAVKDDFQLKSTLIGVIPVFEKDTHLITGLTVLGEELFVVQKLGSEGILVYNTINFACIRNMYMPSNKTIGTIVACSHNKCRYMSDK